MSDVSEIEYAIACTGGVRELRRGTQIGRFAVRTSRGEHAWGWDNGNYVASRDFKVDHVPSGIGVCSVETYADAVAFADDLSRFCPVDVDATTIERFAEQIGPDINAWIDVIAETGKHTPYRDWLAQQRSKGDA